MTTREKEHSDTLTALLALQAEWREEWVRMLKWLDFNDAHNNIQPEDAASVLKECADALEPLIRSLRDEASARPSVNCDAAFTQRVSHEASVRPPQHAARLVTVCDGCLRASCWNMIYPCESAKTAGITHRTVAELRVLGREHERYWESDREASVGCDHHASSPPDGSSPQTKEKE